MAWGKYGIKSIVGELTFDIKCRVEEEATLWSMIMRGVITHTSGGADLRSLIIFITHPNTRPESQCYLPPESASSQKPRVVEKWGSWKFSKGQTSLRYGFLRIAG